VDAVADSGEVGGVVAVAAVALAHHERDGIAVRAGDFLGEDHQGVVAVDDDPGVDEFGDRVGEHRIVERLADRILRGEQHAEPVIDVRNAFSDSSTISFQRATVTRRTAS
jgi:hypothetical protein